MAPFFRRTRKDDKTAGDEWFTRGQWGQALAAYERVAARDPGNLPVLRRVADLRAKVGRRGDAVAAYRTLADRYAADGFLVQAIAIYKILRRLDPEGDDVAHRLAELYAQRGIGTAPTPAAPAEKPLPDIPLFSDLDPAAFRQVLARVAPRTLAEGETLFREGDPGDSIFVVASGAVRVVRAGAVLAELGEGTFFGEAAFFSHQPRNADVVAAAGPTELLEIRRDDMETLMAAHPGVADALALFYRRRVLDGVLASSDLFQHLPEAERIRLADRFRVVPVVTGDAVVREGDTDRALFLVKRGRFAVTVTPPGGGAAPAKVGELGPGDLFGEVALVSDAPRTATVQALEDGEVLRAEAADVEAVMGDHPGFRAALEALRDRRAADTVAKLLGKRP